MSLIEILSSSGGAILVLFTLVQIAPVKLNPWSWIAKKLGRALNSETIEKVDKLCDDVQALRNECDERQAVNCRTCIMRFGDEILHGTKHSKEHFDQILLDITSYEKYCEQHPNFENNIAVVTVQHIKRVYQNCLEENSFI